MSLVDMISVIILLIGIRLYWARRQKILNTSKAIYWAASIGELSVINSYWNSKFLDINWQDKYGRTALYVACESGKDEVVKLLLSRNDIDVNLTYEGYSSLCTSVYLEKYSCVKLLLEDSRVNVNLTAASGATPLYIACQKNLVKMVKMLLERKDINVNVCNIHDMSPFDMATLSEHMEVLTILLSDERVDFNRFRKNFHRFLICCETNSKECVKLFLKSPRIDINLSNKFGSPLWYAAMNGCIEVIEYMISSGRQLNINERSGCDNTTPTEMALRMSNSIRHPSDSQEVYSARLKNSKAIFDLLTNFSLYPEETRHKTRISSGWYKETAADFFAIIVLICDDYYKPPERGNFLRFIRMVQMFPTEIQMKICNIVVGYSGDNISTSQFESAYNRLVPHLLLTSNY